MGSHALIVLLALSAAQLKFLNLDRVSMGKISYLFVSLRIFFKEFWLMDDPTPDRRHTRKTKEIFFFSIVKHRGEGKLWINECNKIT